MTVLAGLRVIHLKRTPRLFMATGHESFLLPERNMKHRPQERQYKEQGLFTPVDFESMSHPYHMASQESQDEAMISDFVRFGLFNHVFRQNYPREASEESLFFI